MADPDRILIVRPSALGDVCRTVPVLATLRRAWPEAVIDWVVQTEFVAAVAAHPALDEAIAFPRRDLDGWWRSPGTAGRLRRWLARLRRRRYDVVYDCQGLGRSGFIAWATGAPRRVGPRSARELAWLGYNVRHPDPASRHTVDRMMHLLVADGLEPVYDMRLYAAEADRRWWAERSHVLGLEAAPYAVLAPTARWASKRWPPERWAALLGPLARLGFARVVLIGGPSERDQVQPLLAACEGPALPADLVGGTTVGQTMAVIRGAGVVVANDSAPLHMAIGFERPCVGLFGPTDPETVGPFRAADAVVRAPGAAPAHFKDPSLGDSIMRRIEPAAVVERLEHVLGCAPVGGGS